MLYRVFKNKCRRPSHLIYILGLARFCRVAKLFLLISNFMSMYYNIKENMKTGSREFHDKYNLNEAISTVQQENQHRFVNIDGKATRKLVISPLP